MMYLCHSGARRKRVNGLIEEVSTMKEYQIPNIKAAALTGAVWLIGLGVLLVLSPTAADSLVTRVVTGSFMLAGALFLLKIGLEISAAEDVPVALVKEPARRLDRTRRAA